MKPCPKCGEQIKDTLKFCVYCGCNIAQEEAKAKTKFCGECGAQIEDGMKFCGECGAKVESAPAKNDDPWADVVAESNDDPWASVTQKDSSDDPWTSFAEIKEDKPKAKKQNKATAKKTNKKQASEKKFDPSAQALEKLKQDQGDDFDFDELFDDLGFKDDKSFWRDIKQQDEKSKHWVEDCLESGRKAEKNQNYAEAMSWYQSAADADSSEAMGCVGRFYRYGLGVEKDFEQALYWFEKGAFNYDPQSIAELGLMYFKGEGVKKDEKKGFEYLKDAAERENIDGLLNAASCYVNGFGTEKNIESACIYYERAAMQGSAYAQNQLGIYYYLGQYDRKYKDVYDKVGEPDYLNAEFWFDAAAQRGNVNAMYNLAMLYYNGFGRRKDCGESVDLFGFKKRQIGKPNYELALFWFEKAAEQGNVNAMVYLRIMHFEGKGTKKDEKKAFAYAKKAAETGCSADNKKWLAWFYEQGVGTKKDLAKAKEFYKKAADEGCKESKAKLAKLG